MPGSAVALSIDGPGKRPPQFSLPHPRTADEHHARWTQSIVDLQRGLDLIATRPDVDRDRMGYVGHSYGATLGGVLAGVEKRVQAYVLMAGLVAHSEWWRSGDHEYYRRFREQVTNEQGVSGTQYLFAVPARQLRRHPWREGAVYVLPRETFVQDQVVAAEGRVWKEWPSDEPVRPLGKLVVGPDDFPYLDDVQGFRMMDILRPVVVVVWRQLWHQVRSWLPGRGREEEV